MKTLNAAASIVLLALFAAHRAAAALPDGYVELRAIQGDGVGAYIATGYIPKPNIDRVEAKFRIDVRTDANSTLFCSRIVDGSQKDAWTVFSNLNTSGMRFDYLNNKNNFKTGFTNHQMVELSVSSNVVTFADGSTLASGNPYDPDFTEAGSQMFLFGSNQDASTAVSNWSKDILYSFKVYRNDVLIHDYVPAKRSSDGKIGLYDVVDGIFLANANSSGAFTAIYAEPFHLKGSDAGSTSSMSGLGSCAGWTNAVGAARTAAVAYEDYVVDNGFTIREPAVNYDYTFPGASLTVVKGVVNHGGEAGKKLTIGDLRVPEGGACNFSRAGSSRNLAWGGNYSIAEGGVLTFLLFDDKTNSVSASVSGSGILRFEVYADNRGSRFLDVLSGDLSAFTGSIEICRPSVLEFASAASIPANPPAGETSYVVVTNGAMLIVDQDWDSAANRIWDFGDGGVPTINVAAGKTVTIRGAVAGSVGFKKTGFGTLAFSGEMSGLSGTCEVLSGKVVLEGDACGYAHLFRGRADLIRNGGFEEGTSVVAHGGLYDSNATTDAWGTAPLSKGNSSQGYGVPPSFITGTYCAYIRPTNSISQAFTNTRPVTVTLAFRYMHRTNYFLSTPIYFRLLLDGEPLCNEVSVPCDSTIRTFSLGGIQIPGSLTGHVLRIQGRTDDNADSTFFLDDVSLRSETEVYSPGGKYEWLEIVRPSGAVYYLR